MTDRSTEQTRREILVRGVDDWVHASEVLFVAVQALFGEHRMDGYPHDQSLSIDELAAARSSWLAEQERQALPLAIKAVKELLREGLVRVGDTTTKGFVPWAGSLDEIESQIDSVTRGAGFPLLPGDLFWLENTELGDDAARVA